MKLFVSSEDGSEICNNSGFYSRGGTVTAMERQYRTGFLQALDSASIRHCPSRVLNYISLFYCIKTNNLPGFLSQTNFHISLAKRQNCLIEEISTHFLFKIITNARQAPKPCTFCLLEYSLGV